MPLGNPSVFSGLSSPLLSCPFNLPLCLTLALLLPPLLTSPSHFLCKLSPLRDPGHLALLFYLCLLLALSLVVYLSPPPAPLPPSLLVTAGMQLFNEHSSASSPCSSAYHFPSASPCCISVYRHAAWCGITTAQSPAWCTKICRPGYRHVLKHPFTLPPLYLLRLLTSKPQNAYFMMNLVVSEMSAATSKQFH